VAPSKPDMLRLRLNTCDVLNRGTRHEFRWRMQRLQFSMDKL